MKAFVLQKWPYSENDWIVEFFCEDAKIRKLFAHGARRSKRRFPHQFHAAGLYEIEWKESRLQSCELIKYEEGISADLEKWTRWLCILEWIKVDEATSCQFEETQALLQAFVESPTYQSYFYEFFGRQIYRHGLFSDLDRCMSCGEALGSEALDFSFSDGGLCHSRCRRGVSFDAQALHFLEAVRFELEPPRHLSPEASFSLESSLLGFLEFQLGRKLKTHHFLQKIRHLGQNPQEKSWQNSSSPMF